MSILGDMVLVAVASASASAAWAAVYGHYKVKAAKAMGAPTEEPTFDDARKTAEQIGSILCHRMYVLGMPGFAKDGKYGMLSSFGMNRCYELINCIRFLHYVGIGIVLRHKADTDIEENPEEVETWLRGQNRSWYCSIDK